MTNVGDKDNNNTVTVIRQKQGLSDIDHIFIPELNFNCFVNAPSGKYKLIEFPCKECHNIVIHFVIETKNGNRIFNYGIKFLALYCTKCGYGGEFNNDAGGDPWKSLEKMDLYRTTLDFIKDLDYENRQQWILNLKNRYNLS